MKLLTVAVPSYNMERLLPGCLDCFAQDELKGIVEVIVVNDGSADGTGEIAAGYARLMPEVFIAVNQENAGHGGAVNAAIALASGKYFRIVDADDRVNVKSLAHLFEHMAQTDADLIIDEKTEVNAGTGIHMRFPLPGDLECDTVLPFPESFQPGMAGHFMIHNMSVKTSLLRENNVRLLENTYYVDYEFALAASAAAWNVLFLRLPVYEYTVGNVSQSTSLQNYVKHYEDHLRVVSRCLEIYRKSRRAACGTYLAQRLRMLLYTHINICLLYDKDGKRGRARARALLSLLRLFEPEMIKEVRKRFMQAMALNLLGIRFTKIKKRRSTA